MNYFLLIGTLTLLMQVAVIFLVASAYSFRKALKFRAHGIVMAASVALHLVSIAMIMVPSFVEGLVPLIAKAPFSEINVLASIHAVLGSAVAVLGVWIVGAWRFRHSLQFCVPKRRWMLATLWIWLASLALGFLLYLALFWSQLFA